VPVRRGDHAPRWILRQERRRRWDVRRRRTIEGGRPARRSVSPYRSQAAVCPPCGSLYAIHHGGPPHLVDQSCLPPLEHRHLARRRVVRRHMLASSDPASGYAVLLRSSAPGGTGRHIRSTVIRWRRRSNRSSVLTTAPYAVPSSNAARSSGRPPAHTSGQNASGASIRNSTAAHVASWPLRNQDRRTGLNLEAVAADQ